MEGYVIHPDLPWTLGSSYYYAETNLHLEVLIKLSPTEGRSCGPLKSYTINKHLIIFINLICIYQIIYVNIYLTIKSNTTMFLGRKSYI